MAMLVQDARTPDHAEWSKRGAEENERFAALVRSLEPDDWSRPTDCSAWDVRALVGHVLAGWEADASMREFVHQLRRARRRSESAFIDRLTAVGVIEREHLSVDELVAKLVEVGPRAARARASVPALLRRIPVRLEVGDHKETWRLGYLLDVIETRDTWMHRVDLCRATGRELELTRDHDGVIVADVVAEWARRHGQPFSLRLIGPAGGEFGAGGEVHELDAVEFCRVVSGRGAGTGLLAHEVPF